MKFKHYIQSIFTVATLTLTGCGDFLEPDSKSEFVPDDATSLNELLLGEAYLRNDMSGFNIYLGLLDDDIEAAPYQRPVDGYDANKYLATFTWQPDMYEMMDEAGSGHINIYEKYYEVILGANAVIDYIPEVTDTELNINKVKAQAYALRGFYYFNLVNLYGHPYNEAPESLGVPLKLNSGIEENEDQLARKTVHEVYEQILSDLHTAEETYMSMPEAYHWEANYRTSLPMVQLLLSRVYLYMENWEEAAKYAQAVMKNSNFSLLNLETWETSVIYTSYTNPETIWAYGNVGDMFEWTHAYANTIHNLTNTKMHSYFQASQSLIESFDEYDLRIYSYIYLNETTNTPMYMPYGKVTIGETSHIPVNATNVFGRGLRLSEAYLNYIEACAMQDGNRDEEAVSALNALRERRYSYEDFEEIEFDSNEELIEFVREERRRELCFEGHRWFDLRRWGMPSFTHTWHDSEGESSVYRIEEKDLQYTLPIPDEAMEMNASLIQNELADKRQAIEKIVNE